jgi:hypothetical protein
VKSQADSTRDFQGILDSIATRAFALLSAGEEEAMKAELVRVFTLKADDELDRDRATPGVAPIVGSSGEPQRYEHGPDRRQDQEQARVARPGTPLRLGDGAAAGPFSLSRVTGGILLRFRCTGRRSRCPRQSGGTRSVDSRRREVPIGRTETSDGLARAPRR